MVPSASVDACVETPYGICSLSSEKLDAGSIVKMLEDNTAGATVAFVGTTRNSYQGKPVSHLEYQAYSKLCTKTIAGIIESAYHITAENGSAIIKSAVFHRIGCVPAGDVTVVIAVSSPHRKEAFVACEYILERVKMKAEIWKREFFEGESEESAIWKVNE